MKAIQVKGISKRYGQTTALQRLSFELEQGDAVALIGPNGAGKTTLLRILATLVKPSSGYAMVMELDGRFQASRIRRQLGYMPDTFGMYDDLSVEEYLEFFAGIYAIHGKQRAARVRDLLELLELQGVKAQATSALSRGYQQRVGLARTLIHDPPILLLDEPAANLDPRSRIELREVLKELQRMGKTVLISSHILMELDELCNKVLFLDQGKLVYFGSIAEIATQLRPSKEIAIRLGGEHEKLQALLEAEEAVEDVSETDGELRVRLKPGVKDYSFIVRHAAERKERLLELRELEARLEDIFVRLAREGRSE